MRRLYLVAYDISNAVRLRRVHKTMKGYGDRIQYSVFLCTLSKRELTEMKWDLEEVIDGFADQILIVDLGAGDGSANGRFQFLGYPPDLPAGGATIV